MHIDKNTVFSAKPPNFLQGQLFNIPLFFPRALRAKKILYCSKYSLISDTIALQKAKQEVHADRDFKTTFPTRQSCLADDSCQGGQLLERSNANILTPQDCLDSI